MSAEFVQRVGMEMDSEIELQQTEHSNHQLDKLNDQQKIQFLLDQIETIEKSVLVHVPKLKKKDLEIDINTLRENMEETMILHSHIIDDIYSLRSAQEQLKTLLNGLVGILHHSLKFKNPFKLKTTKEMDTYIAKEPSYNTLNIRIRNVQNMIDKSLEYSALLKQKIGFIRDLLKDRTQDKYSATQ